MSQAPKPERPALAQRHVGPNAQAQAPATGTDKPIGSSNAPPLPGPDCPCVPVLLEIRDLLHQLLKSRRPGKAAPVPPMTQWSRPMTLIEVAACYDVCERTMRGWLALPGGNGIRHKWVGKQLMIDQRDLPASQRGS